ncbi:CASP-like protein 4A4 [Hevea brasiliensis]|uniref:CASP-like protein 4A4 n=1 Tax=Hevea brasiliensis TaxID=3981 RepID=UPI000B77EC13|nr:CASP-like protein 4A4 [Hevea brasiliensis]
MKQEGEVLVVACRPVAGVSPVSANSIAQRPFPTPSPFSLSDASTWWSSRPSIHYSNLLLRFLTLVFSFVSALSLAASSSKKNGQLFTGYSELVYCFIVYILVFVYSAFQLFKGIYDIAQRGILISDMVSDYLSFILDQLLGYLLISACSVAILASQQKSKTASLWKVISFADFLVIATCTLLSGYKLCKRIIW